MVKKIEVACSCGSLVRSEHLELLEAQREEKLKRQETIKENYSEKWRIATCNNLCITNDIRLLRGKLLLKLREKSKKRKTNQLKALAFQIKFCIKGYDLDNF